jgi:mannose-6-phosphate isomerase-like protein (cupin superfamily)
MGSFPPRRVVTGLDASGRSTVISDGPPGHGFDSGVGYRNVDVWYLPAWPTSPTDGGDRPDGPYDMEPAPGAISWQVHEIPPEVAPLADDVTVGGMPRDERFDASRPGRHRTETLDLLYMLDGATVMGLDDGEVPVRGDDVVVQRGTWHSWHNRTGRSYGASVVMFRVPEGTPPPGPTTPGSVAVGPPDPAGRGPRRLVTGTTADGGAHLAADGPVPHAVFVEHAPGMAQIELWQTLGPVVDAGQGGDDPDGTFSLDPIGGGASWRLVTLPAAGALDHVDREAMVAEIRRRLPALLTSGEHDPARPGRHRTDTIDLLQITSGRVWLVLDAMEVELGPGDCVVQRGTWHTWENRGDEPVTWSVVQLGFGGGAAG